MNANPNPVSCACNKKKLFSIEDSCYDVMNKQSTKDHVHSAGNKKSSYLHQMHESSSNIKPKKTDFRGNGKNAKMKTKQEKLLRNGGTIDSNGELRCKLKRPDKALYIPRALRLKRETVCPVQQGEIEVFCKDNTGSGNEMTIEKIAQELDSVEPEGSDSSECSTLINRIAINANNQTCGEICKNSSKCKSCLPAENDNYMQEVNFNMSDKHEHTKMETKHQLMSETDYFISSCSKEDLVLCTSSENIFKTCKYTSITDYANKSRIACMPKGPCISVTEEPHAKVYSQSELLEDSKKATEHHIIESSALNSDNESWDSMFNDQGECLNPDALKELTAVIGSTEAELAKNDYFNFNLPNEDCATKNTSDAEELSHIVELHGFPVAFTTQDLVSALSCFKSEDFTIKWVDDSHALAVFVGPFMAIQALELEHPFVKVRPLSQGIQASRLKAKNCVASLEPVRPRPATTVTLARRLVTGALGLKVNVSKEQREKEKQKILEAKARRQEAAKQRKNMWDGVVS